MATKSTFYRGNREAPAPERHQFHLVLTAADHEKLQKLTHTMRMSAADVVRTLLRKAAGRVERSETKPPVGT